MEINHSQLNLKAYAAPSSPAVEKVAVEPKVKIEAAPPIETKAADVATLKEEANKTNLLLERSGQNIAFSVDEATNASVVRLVDKETDEVIRQFPNEGSLKIMQNIQNYLDSVNEGGFKNKEGLTGSLINGII